MICITRLLLSLIDRELLAAKLRLESDFSAQRSAMNENRSRVEMLEDVLAKEAVIDLLEIVQNFNLYL